MTAEQFEKVRACLMLATLRYGHNKLGKQSRCSCMRDTCSRIVEDCGEAVDASHVDSEHTETSMTMRTNGSLAGVQHRYIFERHEPSHDCAACGHSHVSVLRGLDCHVTASTCCTVM